jgi:hypothetical protein
MVGLFKTFEPSVKGLNRLDSVIYDNMSIHRLRNASGRRDVILNFGEYKIDLRRESVVVTCKKTGSSREIYEPNYLIFDELETDKIVTVLSNSDHSVCFSSARSFDVELFDEPYTCETMGSSDHYAVKCEDGSYTTVALTSKN